MKHSINGYKVMFNKSYDRHTNEGIMIATRTRADGTEEMLKTCVDDSISTFVSMLESKRHAD
jgi:hypothetical protein